MNQSTLLPHTTCNTFGLLICQINNKIQLNQLNQRWTTNGVETTTNQIHSTINKFTSVSPFTLNVCVCVCEWCVINRTHKIDKTLEILTIDFWLHSHSHSQFEHFNCSAFYFYAIGTGIRKQAHIKRWKNITMNSRMSRCWNLLVKTFWNSADFDFTKPPPDWVKRCCLSCCVYFQYWFHHTSANGKLFSIHIFTLTWYFWLHQRSMV